MWTVGGVSDQSVCSVGVTDVNTIVYGTEGASKTALVTSLLCIVGMFVGLSLE